MPILSDGDSDRVEFDKHTAIEMREAGTFRAELHEGWWIDRGANGGYLAAIALRAMEREVPDFPVRTLTTHYTGSPNPGPLEITTTLERRGRSMATVSARATQDDRLIALSLGAFGSARESPLVLARQAPAAPPPERCARFEGFRPMHARWDYRWVYGAPPGSASSEAVVGGWIRLAEAIRPDTRVVAAVCDAFSPPCFSLASSVEGFGSIPTIELTIHFRRALPVPSARSDEYLLARFASHSVHEGFVEEHGEVWSCRGELLAESRQLAVLLAAK